ncbi:MAG: AAA family ATPase [Tardiphaga sp.]
MNISLQQLAQALGGEISNGQVLAPGPQHSPKDRSLAVKLSGTAPDGFVVFSFAGDDDIECRDYVRAKVGAPAFKPTRKANGNAGSKAGVAAKEYKRSPQMEAMLAANAAAIAQRQGDQSPRGRVTHTYDYTDNTGALVFQVLRYEKPKRFSQRRPDPDHPGGWINDLEGVDRVPYRLPDVLQFPGATLFVCEGEKDTDNCSALGLCATTATGGKWTTSCIRALTGREAPFADGEDRFSARDIVIVQDNDEPGAKKALAAAQALSGYAKSVRIVLLPGLPAGGGDLTDWLEDTAALPRHDRDLLIKLCLQVPPWAPDPAAENATDAADDTADDDGEPHPPRVCDTEWCWIKPEEIPRRQWLYSTSLIRKFVSATIAPGGAGKSSMTIVEVLEMVAGKPLLLDAARAPLRVWYWNLEDPRDEIERRIAATCGFYKLVAGDLVGRLFADSGRDRPCVIARYNGHRQVVLDEELIAGLVAEIQRRKIDVLVIDPLKRAHQIDENDNTAVDIVVKAFAGIADEANCAVMLVHHTRKMGGADITAESARGAKALVDGCRSVRVLNGMSKDEGERAGIADDHRRYFRVYPDKLNLAPPPDVSDWFKLESVHLGNGHDGSAGDNVGVATPWQWPDAFANVTAATLLAVQHKVNGGQWRDHPRAENWVGKAVAEVLDLDLDRKPDRATVNTLLKTWIKSGALKQIERLDEHRHEKTFIEVGAWAT